MIENQQQKESELKDENISNGFDNYINIISYGINEKKIKWKSDVREKDIERKRNENKIYNLELLQVDYKNPLTILPPLYIQNKYCVSLFQSELSEVHDKDLNADDIIKIMEKRENLEILNKIIKNYLNYISYENYERISKNIVHTIIVKRFEKLNLLDILNQEAYSYIKKNRYNIKVMKRYFLYNSSKIILRHSKLNKAQKIREIVINIIQKLYFKVKNLKLKNYSYFSFYKENLSLQNSINAIIKDYPEIHIIHLLLDKLKKNNEKFTIKFKDDIDKIFEEKKENLFDLYCLYSATSSSNENNHISEFIEIAQNKFKQKSKFIIIQTFHSFNKENDNYPIDKLKKISNILNLKFEETKFIEAFIETLLKLLKLIEIYIFYCESKEKTEYSIKLSHEFKTKSNIFFNIIDKHLSKLLTTIHFILRQYSSKRDVLIILNFSFIFEEYIKSKLNVNSSKYFTLASKNLVLNIIKYENVGNIKKVGILLSGDIWEKTELEENFDLFSINKIEEKTPLFMRNYLIGFNEVKDIVNKQTIDDIFKNCFMNNNAMSNVNKNKRNNTQMITIEFFVNILKNAHQNKNTEIVILSKPLLPSKLVISSSTFSIIMALFDLVFDLVFFDSIVFEIFFQIFNLLDYYIFAAVNMSITEKKCINDLIQNLNYDEIKKKEKLEYGSEMTLYQLKFINFRKFFLSTKKKLEVLFQQKQGLNLENKMSFDNNYEINSFYLPKMSSDLDNTDSTDKYVKSNYYQKIIIIETVNSLYKILKRLEHFKLKIQLEFLSENISETISQYKSVIKEARMFIFLMLAKDLIDIDEIKNDIYNFRWEPSESEAETQLFEASPFVDKIIKQTEAAYNNLNRLNEFSIKLKSYLFEVFVDYIVDFLMEAFSKVRKCNPTGRSIMLKDLKFIKQKLEDQMKKRWKFQINFDEKFSLILAYINSWYYDNDELFKFFFENVSYYIYVNYRIWSINIGLVFLILVLYSITFQEDKERILYRKLKNSTIRKF